jgi:hypothetical protein
VTGLPTSRSGAISAEDLTGLSVAERKNVSGINREVAVTTDPSCLNRWLTRAAGRSGH